MANCLPFDSVVVDEQYDRVYKAEDWAWYFATFIANGIFPKPSDGLQVIAYNGMEIKINAGYAFINGYAFRNPTSQSITLNTAEGVLNRIDRVIVRWDLTQRDMYLTVLKGVPSAKPVATDVTRSTEIWELALADIYIGKGVTRILTQNITDQRFNSAVCGIVKGTIEEIDASVLTKQFTDFFNTYSANVSNEFDAYIQSMEAYLERQDNAYNEFVERCKASLEKLGTDTNKKIGEIMDALSDLVDTNGPWRSDISYKRYSIVTLGNEGEKGTYIALNNVPVGVAPLNELYWAPITLRGEKGETGESGVVVHASGLFTLSVDAEGNLWVHYEDGERTPQFEYDEENGDLYYIIPEE